MRSSSCAERRTRTVSQRNHWVGIATVVIGLASLTVAPVASADPLLGVTVTAQVHRSDYSRAGFGKGWPQDAANCDIRDDILDRDLVDKTFVTTKRCPDAVATGTLHDPYTGTTIAFTRGETTGAAVQIDHIVPLSYAWDMGAWAWSPQKRATFYADPEELIAVSGPANDAKGDSPPSRWMPPNASFDCVYVGRFMKVLSDYTLPIDPASADVVRRVMAGCGS
jgi:Protein of unknown function (DUF1524)